MIKDTMHSEYLSVPLTENWEVDDEEFFLDGPATKRVAILDFNPETGELTPGVRFLPPTGRQKIGWYDVPKKPQTLEEVLRKGRRKGKRKRKEDAARFFLAGDSGPAAVQACHEAHDKLPVATFTPDLRKDFAEVFDFVAELEASEQYVAAHPLSRAQKAAARKARFW
jgi:hypothetical protein